MKKGIYLAFLCNPSAAKRYAELIKAVSEYAAPVDVLVVPSDELAAARASFDIVIQSPLAILDHLPYLAPNVSHAHEIEGVTVITTPAISVNSPPLELKGLDRSLSSYLDPAFQSFVWSRVLETAKRTLATIEKPAIRICLDMEMLLFREEVARSPTVWLNIGHLLAALRESAA